MLKRIFIISKSRILSGIALIIYLSLMTGCAPYSLPEKKSYSEQDDPYIYYAESLEAYEAKDYQLALQKINQALMLNDNLAQFYQLQGVIHEAVDENNKAIDSYKTAIKKRSNFLEVHEALADLYEKQKLCKEAIRYYKRTVGLDPSRIDIILQIVNCYIQLNEMDVAEHHLNSYKKSALELKKPLSEQYYVLRGEVLFLTNRYEESLRFLNNVSQPDSLALYLYGKNYYALKDFSKGVTYFNELLKKDKDNGSWYFYRGIYFFNQNDYLDAKGQFEYGLMLDETLYETHYYLGKIYLNEGDENNALKEFRIFHQHEKVSEKAQEVDKMIQSLEPAGE
jgi:tetratricopeptide (TPR) repeat protein